MTDRLPQDFVNDMIEYGHRAMRYVTGLSREEFFDKSLYCDAVARAIETMGEAARGIDVSIQDQFPAVPWRQIIGMRHKIAHDYIQLNLEILWLVATKEVTTLLPDLIAMRDKLQTTPSEVKN